MQLPDDIIKFWFHDVTDQHVIDKKKEPYSSWFKKNDVFDLTIKERFEEHVLKAEQGKYDSWKKSMHGRLALILLWDQFPRNIYRGTPDMFRFDSLALDLVKDTLAKHWDQQAACIYRVFIYMPLMHAENIESQEMCVDKFEELMEFSMTTCPDNTDYFAYNLKYAIQHQNIIEQFNRFPHRNKILGRESTPKEKEFLEKPGSSF